MSMRYTISTPWGPAQDAELIAEGIIRYDTPSHGGYHVSDERLAEMPAVLRVVKPYAGRGWYEEDEDWQIVALAWPELFAASSVYFALLNERNRTALYADTNLFGGKPAERFDIDAYLRTDAGRKAEAIAAEWFEANRDKYRMGCSGCGAGESFLSGSRIGDPSDWITVRSTQGLWRVPSIFTVADVLAVDPGARIETQREATR